MMVEHTLFLRFGVALFIGMLAGLQREYAADQDEQESQRSRKIFAGVRTFSLIGLSGCTAAFIADLLDSPWVFAAIFLGLGALLTVSYFITARKGEVGMTSEVSAILIFLTGALSFWDQMPLAVAIGVVTTVLLSLKLEMHRFAANLTREDVLAALKFAIITAIILPLLPNEALGPPPFDVLNPYKIWLMVVFISGINFLGYVLIKMVGAGRGIGLTGFMGGLASSTATTLSFTQRSHEALNLAKPFALAITLAWTVMFGRVLVEVAVVHTPLLTPLLLPMLGTGLVALGYAAVLYYLQQSSEKATEVTLSNPFELRLAITFGLLYAVILLISRSAELYFGNAGLYISAVVSGFADVDAITLSMAELSRTGGVALETAARAIVLATMSNTVVKGVIVLTAGAMVLRRVFWPGFLAILATGLLLAFLL